MHTTWANAHPLQLPIGAEQQFIGLIDLLDMKAHIYDEKDPMGQKFNIVDIPEDMLEDAKTYRQELVESIVETNDELMEAYLEGKELDLDKLKAALRKAICDNKVIPILCGSAFKNKGVQQLLDAVVDYLPAPIDVAAIKGTLPDGTETDTSS